MEKWPGKNQWAGSKLREEKSQYVSMTVKETKVDVSIFRK